jgi:ComEC/Rec2-related protein
MIRNRERDEAIVTDERQFFRPLSMPAETGEQTAAPVTADAVSVRVRRFRLPSLVRLARALRKATERERALGTAFLFMPVWLVAGVAYYFQMGHEPEPWNHALGLAVVASLALFLRNRVTNVAPLVMAVALFVGGMAIAQLHTILKATPMLGSAVTTRITGQIVAIEPRADGRTRFTIELLTTERPRLRYAPDRIRVTSGSLPGGSHVGGGIAGLVRLLPPSGPFHSGGYDFTLNAYFDGYGANGFFMGDPALVEIAPVSATEGIPLIVERLRQTIMSEILRVTEGRGGAVSVTLVTGNRSLIPEDVAEALRVSGLAHILSISGLHMALVAATVMLVLRFAFSLAPNWSARRPVKKYAAAVALAATGFYLFLAGAGVATQRSFVMLAIILLALFFDRNAITMRNLALAAIAVVLIAPHEVIGPGFQMSFAATAALIAAYAAWQDLRRKRQASRRSDFAEHGPIRSAGESALKFVLGLAVTSLVAGLATGIFASYHFGRIAPYGLLGNLAAMPVVTLLVMPLAILSMVLLPFGLHAWPFRAMAWSVEQVIVIAERVASLSPPVATGQMPDTALLLFVSGFTILCLMTTWLRLCGLPFLLAGIFVWQNSGTPLAIVSEDARQFAVVKTAADGRQLHVNRSRPNGFTMELWRGALAAADLVKPGDSDVMQCADDTCTATVGGARGLRLGYVTNTGKAIDEPGAYRDWADKQAAACKAYDIVIFADAPSWQFCPQGQPVITAKMLALQGAAEIFVTQASNQVEIIHSTPGPVRPWLDHRRYSRAARNLPERLRRRSQ